MKRRLSAAMALLLALGGLVVVNARFGDAAVLRGAST